MRLYTVVVLAVIVLILTGCESQPASISSPTPAPSVSPSSTVTPAPATTGMKTSHSGLQYEELEVGSGPRPLFNQTVMVRYTGWLTNGTKFDSNVDNDKKALEFKVGLGGVIKGWEIGIGGGDGIEPMRVGGRRKLIIPPQLGYGDEANGPIPAKSTLVFEVELVGIRPSRPGL